MKRKKKKIVIVIIIALIVIAAFAIKLLSPKKNTAPVVSTEKVKTAKITSVVEASGNVALARRNRFYSSSSATISEIYIKEGDVVKKGQKLFTYNEKALDDLKNQLADAQLDIKSNEVALKSVNVEIDDSEIKEYSADIKKCDTNIEAFNYKIEQLDIQIKQGENDLNKAKEDYDNNKLLYDNGGLSLEELKNSENEYNKKLNDLELLKSQKKSEQLSLNTEKANKEVALAKYNRLMNQNNTAEVKNKKEAQSVLLQQSKLKSQQIQERINKFKTVETAPCDGVIINLQEEFMSGAAVSEGTYLFEIADKNVIINLDVPEYDIHSVALNQYTAITFDGLDGELKGKVTKIYPTSEKKTINKSEKNVVTVEVTVTDKADLNIGFNVEGRILTSVNENAVVIPVSSYLTDEFGQDYVYVVNENNVIEKKYIKIKTFDNMNIEIEGLNIGENVVNAPDETKISPGMPVSLTEANSND